MRFHLGLDTYSLHLHSDVWGDAPAEPLNVFGMLRLARSLGLDGMQTADMGHFSSLSAEDVERFSALLREAGMYVEVGTGGASPEKLRPAFDLASTLGARVVRTFLGFGRTWKPSSFCGDRRAAVEGLRKSAGLCEEYGVLLAVENHQDLTSAELLSVLDEVGSEKTGVCLDTGNALGVLKDPLAAAKVLAPRTFSVHLKDYRLFPSRDGCALVGVALGNGDVPLRAILEELERSSPVDELALNIESAVEYIPLCEGRRGWKKELGPRARELVQRFGASDREPPDVERFLALSEKEKLAHERAQVEKSVAYARELLGRE